MENEDLIDKDNEEIVSGEAGTDESAKFVFYRYRGVGKCISDGVSFLTDHFLRFIKLSLPVSVLLAALSAAYTYIVCNLSLMQSGNIMYILLALGGGIFVTYSAFQGVIYRLLKLRAEGEDMKTVTFDRLYKPMWRGFAKMLGYNALAVVLAVVVGMVGRLILWMPSDELDIHILKFILLAIWLLVALVICLPYDISLPSLMLSKKSFFPALWHGYMLGFKKIGKVLSLFVVLLLIVGLVAVLFLSPAVIIAMVQHSASFSMMAGDLVHLPDNFAVYSILVLFLSSFLSILLSWVYFMPMAYLYAALTYDAEEQKKNEMPII